MNHRLRASFLTLVALVVSGLFSVTAAAPARADAGTTCLHPQLSGTIGVTTDAEGTRRATYTGTVGYTRATCSSPSWFSSGYWYRVSFFPWPSHDSTSVQSSQLTAYSSCYRCVPSGTRITFPNASALIDSSTVESTYIKIEAFQGTIYGEPSATETQYYRVHGTGSYSTAGLTQVASPTSCDSGGVPEPLIGTKGFCP